MGREFGDLSGGLVGAAIIVVGLLLAALVITPLHTVEYLVAKALSLALLAVLVSVAVALVAYGTTINWLLFVSGVALNSWMLILVGFILFEPMGIYGRWLKIRTYFELVPFYRKDMFRRQKSYLKTERTR